MIIDSSALVALMWSEDDAHTFGTALTSTAVLAMAAPSYLETSIVVTPELHVQLDSLIDDLDIEVVPFDRALARAARTAYARFGKGSGSRAQLNLGDCVSYALAVTRGEPLLFKGDDFHHTDVVPALPRG